MLLHEGRLAGLGLTPLDDETQADAQRIDLGMLLTLTPENYAPLALASLPQPLPNTQDLTLSLYGVGFSFQNYGHGSPLFKMHRELARLGSTSSEDSVSESETDHSSSNNSSNSGSTSSSNTVETTQTTG
ncbi:hypothetical protein EAH_00064240 [Eimeria acervulina]|uniref:Uncharacterized protein n=1 Tax=Eimeria acervulina TaxID=5801 RepID=U6GTU8_EIMAC|nr:hypothetical protein EAH_00064240 [Eimeria acervulina]CDI81999.1 hypothetical protein EAH_00064240 [Eimeria acervulina]